MKSWHYTCDGTRLFAVEQGQGPCIVLLHGGMADHRAVEPYLQALSTQFRVVAPDLRCNGKSWSAATPTFDEFTRDLRALIDHAGERSVVLVGVSSGTGVAVHFALRHPDVLAGLVLLQPIYAGERLGLSAVQAAMFAWMDGMASQTLDRGVEVLSPLYAQLPEGIREQAMAMTREYDPASVVAMSRFLASGVQPFADLAQLSQIRTRTLVVKGDDPMHPGSVADGYLSRLEGARSLGAQDTALMARIGEFCTECFAAGEPNRPGASAD
jgi:3-oxoadipate enol-lactonase